MPGAESNEWPPAGFELVGEYAFPLPDVPTLEQVEEVEQFIFTQKAFAAIAEGQRRLNVIRIAVDNVISERALANAELKRQTSIIPMIGRVSVTVTSTRHEGTVVRAYKVNEDPSA